MKKAVLPLIILLFLLAACNNGNPTSKELKNDNQSSFWDKPTMLKQEFLKQLKNNTEDQDEIVVKFLNDYKDLVNQAYDTLNEQGIYDYSPQIENNLRKSGFETGHNEDGSYVAQNTGFLKSETEQLLNETSLNFLNVYCYEIDNNCNIESTIISGKLLVLGILESGELLEKVKGSKYEKITREIFDMYLHILFFGIEEYPAFNFVTDKFDQETYNNMNEIIKKHPNSIAAHKFTVFVDLLTKSNLTKNKDIENFLDNLVL